MENKLLAEAFVQIYTDFDASEVASKLNNDNSTAVNILVRLLEDIGKKKKDLNKNRIVAQSYKISSKQFY